MRVAEAEASSRDTLMSVVGAEVLARATQMRVGEADVLALLYFPSLHQPYTCFVCCRQTVDTVDS